jgi:2,4-dienoyl-CoA reductase-like NADH-dependent reductase (Old Yellow Enzyme family)
MLPLIGAIMKQPAPPSTCVSAPEGEVLFEPMKIGTMEVAGRVFKAPTTETRGSEDGFVTDRLLAFYEPLARAGTPLVVTGMLYVDVRGKAFYRSCGIDADDKLPGLRRWTDLVHAHGSKLLAQLGHCGRQVFPREMGIPAALSASPVREKILGTKPRGMTREQIRETVEAFAAAAVRAREAGFDGIQLQAAVGYLLSAFLTPYTNRRRDEYGGSPRNRMRLLVEVVRATRERVGDDFPVTARLNGTDALAGRDGLRAGDLVEVARALESEGVDAIEITAGHYESGLMMARGRFDDFFTTCVTAGRMTRGLPGWRRRAAQLTAPAMTAVANRLWGPREGFLLRYAARFTRALEIPVVCVGGFHTREAMEAAIRSGACDAVSVARGMVADPFLVRHLREGRPGPQCSFCNGCMARVGYLPIDCYDPLVRAQRDALLAAEGLVG